jgi:hypothetical protein
MGSATGQRAVRFWVLIGLLVLLVIRLLGVPMLVCVPPPLNGVITIDLKPNQLRPCQ